MSTLTSLANTLCLGVPARRATSRKAVASHLRAETDEQANRELELFHASAFERFAVALTAPFRESFSLELHAAARDGRSAPTLEVITLPGRPSWWRQPLAHCFGVTDMESAERVVTQLGTTARRTTPWSTEGATFLLAQSLHVAMVSAGLGYLGRERSLDLAALPVGLALEMHHSWGEFATALALGQQLGARNQAQAIAFGQAIGRLASDRRSPWQLVAWGSATPTPVADAPVLALAS